MNRERMLTMIRTLARLSAEQLAEVEQFIQALDPDLTGGQLEAVCLYVAVQGARLDERQVRRSS